MTQSDTTSRDNPTLQYREERNDGTNVRLYLSGEVDMRVAPDLRTLLHRVIEEDPAELAVDLADVPFIDSSGVATLVEAQRILMGKEKKIRLENPSDAVRYTLKITQLLRVFGIEEDDTEK